EDAFDFPRRFQVHVRIDPGTQTAEEHFLYAHDQVETLARAPGVVYEWALAVEVEAPGEPPARIRLGSDGRLAAVEPVERDLYRPPDELLRAFDEVKPRGLRLVAVTPLVFSGGWLPDGLAEEGGRFAGEILPGAGPFILRAAVVGRPLPVSGWDMAAGGPKMTIRAVPQGSVYFFERADGRPFGRQDAERFWLAALGSRTADGFGRVVPGIWSGSDERGDDDETRRRSG
ncbi:MAG: hypothetical protein IRZ11_08790, partial [Clostridia bacterium]|nr:hypothetical protein [Clostridia bacterium]